MFTDKDSFPIERSVFFMYNLNGEFFIEGYQYAEKNSIR